MKGVTILKNEKKNRKIVQFDVKEIAKSPSKFENFIDVLVAEERRNEKDIKLKDMKTLIKILIYIIFLITTPKMYSQNIMRFTDSNLNIRIPLINSFEKLPKELSSQIKTNGTFNIVTFQTGNELEDNHITLYGFVNSSRYTTKKEFFGVKKLKEIFLKNEISLSSSNVLPLLDKVKKILFEYYKSDALKREQISQIADSINSGNINNYLTTGKPVTIFENEYGFINKVEFKIKLLGLETYVSTLMSVIFLDNHLIGMSGNISAIDSIQFENKILLAENFFLQLQVLNPNK